MVDTPSQKARLEHKRFEKKLHLALAWKSGEKWHSKNSINVLLEQSKLLLFLDLKSSKLLTNNNKR